MILKLISSILFIQITLGILAGCQLSQNSFDSPYQATFHQIVDGLAEKSLAFERQALRADSVKRSNEQRISEVKNSSEFVHFLAEFLSELNDPHLTYFPPKQVGQHKLPLRWICLGKHWRALPSPNSSNAPPALFSLHYIDGIRVTRSNIGSILPALSLGRRYSASYLQLLSPSGQVLKFTAFRNLSKPVSAKKEFNASESQFSLSDRWIRVERKENIGYLRILTFSPERTGIALDRMAIELHAAIDQLIGCHKVIIDLQSNSGGRLSLGYELASRFYSGGDAIWIANRASGIFGDRSNPTYLKPQEPLLTTRTVILTDETTASTSEHVIYHLRRSSKAKVIGMQTQGSQFPIDQIETEDGTVVKFSSNKVQFPHTGNFHQSGIIPDITLPLDIEEAKTDGFLKALQTVRRARLMSAFRSLDEPTYSLPRWLDLIYGWK